MVRRDLLQVDKTAPEDQVLLGNEQKRRQDPDLDSHLGIRDHNDPEKGTGDRTVDLRNPTGFERQHI